MTRALLDDVEQFPEPAYAAAPPHLLELFASPGNADYRTLSMLVEKGISGGPDAWRTLHMLTYEGRNSWIAEDLLEKRMWIEVNDYYALKACVENGAVDVAKLLLDGGMDFEQYCQRFPDSGSPDTIQALEEHWQTIQGRGQEQNDAPEVGGMDLG